MLRGLKCLLLKNSLSPDFNGRDRTGGTSPGVPPDSWIHPGNAPVFLTDVSITAPEVEALKSGTTQLHLWGNVTYRDVFGDTKTHRRHFTMTCDLKSGAWFTPRNGRNDEEDYSEGGQETLLPD